MSFGMIGKRKKYKDVSYFKLYEASTPSYYLTPVPMFCGRQSTYWGPYFKGGNTRPIERLSKLKIWDT